MKDTSAADDAACGLQPFHHLTKASVEALRYRGEDIARSITKAVVKEARAKELRLELLNSKRLKAFFEEHPGEQFGPQPIFSVVCQLSSPSSQFSSCEYVFKLCCCIGTLLLCCCDLLSLGGRETVCCSYKQCTEFVGLSIGTVKGCILLVQEIATRNSLLDSFCAFVQFIASACLISSSLGSCDCGAHLLQKVTCVTPNAQGLSVCEHKTWQCCSMQQKH